MQTLGDQVKQMRSVLGMTQQQLAERSGLAQSVIAEIENGNRENLTLPTIQKLAQGLNCRFIPQLIAEKDISVIREERSDYIARKIISISSGSAAIEMQLPTQDAIEKQVETLKQELLEKHGAALWQKI
ncbi:MAG: helix-turn-helix domain-containing protein [Candidatus Omnitrophica bacterium]|nr:helix-turn-helix domain-containing protein [Candidatus Omnitrophota bacterium]